MTITQRPRADVLTPAEFQRPPEPELPYRFWARFADSWAGWRDRRVVAVPQGEGEAASPWLQRHHFACVNRLEAEHRATRAALAQLDHAIVAERQRVETAGAALVTIEDARVRLGGTPLTDAATTLAEQGDGPAARLARRQRGRAAELGRLDAQAAQHQAVAEAARQAIQTLTADRHSHWAVLQVRGSHVVAHYNRRAATYVRSATRKHGGLVRTPTVVEPAWLGQAVPPIPDTHGEDH